MQNLSKESGGERPLISIVICFHNEDFIAGWTLDCVKRMRAYALASGFETELICVLDRADPITTKVVCGHPCINPNDHVIPVDNGDPGYSRNDGVAISRGNFIAILDGDDYCSENWLAAAGNAACAEDKPTVFHPDYIVSFGEHFAITRVTDMRQRKYDLRNCLKVNPWAVTSFGKREIFLAHPYQSADVRQTGFGYEDWEWNLGMTAAGYLHLSVPDTALFYRRKPLSRITNDSNANAVIRPNAFFSAEFQRRLLPTER